MHVIGERDKPIDYRQMLAGEMTNLFLFPTANAVPLSPEFCRTLPRPIRLIVPDGNWGQAARVRGRLPPGAPITYVTLPAGPPTQYRLRREPRQMPAGLATLEAIARTLEIIEGPQVSEPLLDIFRVFVERTLWSRGKLPAHQVYGGIPSL